MKRVCFFEAQPAELVLAHRTRHVVAALVPLDDGAATGTFFHVIVLGAPGPRSPGPATGPPRVPPLATQEAEVRVAAGPLTVQHVAVLTARGDHRVAAVRLGAPPHPGLQGQVASQGELLVQGDEMGGVQGRLDVSGQQRHRTLWAAHGHAGRHHLGACVLVQTGAAGAVRAAGGGGELAPRKPLQAHGALTEHLCCLLIRILI